MEVGVRLYVATYVQVCFAGHSLFSIKQFVAASMTRFGEIELFWLTFKAFWQFTKVKVELGKILTLHL